MRTAAFMSCRAPCRLEHVLLNAQHNTPVGWVSEPTISQARGGTHNEKIGVGTISPIRCHGRIARRVHPPCSREIQLEVRPGGRGGVLCVKSYGIHYTFVRMAAEHGQKQRSTLGYE